MITDHALPQSRFIPIRKNDLFKLLLADDSNNLNSTLFKQYYQLLDNRLHHDFHLLTSNIKDSYATYDPDTSTLDFSENHDSHLFFNKFETLLDKANYELINSNDLANALEKSSLFKIKLHVNLEDFSDKFIYYRGSSIREESVSSFMGLYKRKIRFINYDRVILCLKYSDKYDSDTIPLNDNLSGNIFIKLFRNVPKADLEMLFPNTRIGMRLQDKLLIGIPALVSGGVVLTTKVGTSLILIGSLIGFWLGISNQPVEINTTSIMVLFAGLAALGGYLWKQFNSFKNRKLKFTEALTRNLYFKNLDNNAGVFHRLADEAEEEECKEALLAFYFLSNSNTPMSTQELDQAIEQWLYKKSQLKLNFDIQDALDKLLNMQLIEITNDKYIAVELTVALERLDKYWDTLFSID